MNHNWNGKSCVTSSVCKYLYSLIIVLLWKTNPLAYLCKIRCTIIYQTKYENKYIRCFLADIAPCMGSVTRDSMVEKQPPFLGFHQLAESLSPLS